ncbi:GNAT family N-acetyltransferase [Pectinatus frisingensis]|uniref:GNAT family N-acetyltransferase n=1 Tax=Pectinatus frisingensis TaxID=865 RepID=UPI0015F77197|nr:GNAT family N-acetyltransferase [Pectinatus frisingensis]
MLNSVPASKTVLLDGWVMRLNNNYTYRANCVCPIRYAKEVKIDDRIKICEKLFADNKLPSVFKVTPALQEGFDDILLSHDYHNVKTVQVMYRKLEYEKSNSCAGLSCMHRPDREWLNASVRLSGINLPELITVHCQNLKNIAIESIFVKVTVNGKIIGCGYGTVERGYVGIYDLHVDNDYRCRGIGSAICKAVFSYGMTQNAKSAYLIVHSKNENALSLYSHMGFAALYEYNFYCRDWSNYKIID